jgi:hypothetical protein
MGRAGPGMTGLLRGRRFGVPPTAEKPMETCGGISSTTGTGGTGVVVSQRDRSPRSMAYVETFRILRVDPRETVLVPLVIFKCRIEKTGEPLPAVTR